MRVLMFGWEFPPVVSGGLGTACYGITKALTGLGNPVLFVMPRIELSRPFPLLTLISASDILNAASEREKPFPEDSLLPPSLLSAPIVLRPYLNARQSGGEHQGPRDWPADSYLAAGEGYGVDLFTEVRRYGEAGGLIAARETFDVIHGHDWMTVPACLAARQASGKPFILQIHSLEYDRSGEEINERIFELERFGMEAADQIIAVSHYTKTMIVSRYGIAPEKIFVVYNALSHREAGEIYHTRRAGDDKVVLFMGRITFQKGPDYFIAAAARVLKEMPEVTFIMAGSGDMMPRMVELVAELKIGKRFHFTGFLQGSQVEEAFARADLYVMPSVSEPFGLAPLEAMMYDVPVIISRQSGVSEVLKHALKVDFWDVDEMANKMIAVLKYPPLAGELVERAREELKNLRWEKAVLKILEVYKV
ncbi:MAG: glycosyltransferase family 4 protein [Deltaproteobacteria bacterium]|nr:glycosyltransferase family 4 protein [Deltaproteobacteria bacterium]